jgi:putative transposase
VRIGFDKPDSYYGQVIDETPQNLALMRLIDEQFLQTPWYGNRQMARHLRWLGLEAVYQRPKTTVAHPEHKTWPYLLRNKVIDQPNQAWCADITYIPMRRGFLYLVAVMDWASRKVLSWRLPNTMDVEFCSPACGSLKC